MAGNRRMVLDKPMDRRDFMKLSATTAAVLGLSTTMVPKLCQALEKKEKPAVIWLHFQECTGCTESLLRASEPDVAEVILDIISLEYHETLFAASGHQIEDNLVRAMERYRGKYVLVVEGSIPMKDGGNYCTISGQTAADILKKTAPNAAAIIAIGSCAAWGGIPSAGPNPTGAQGVLTTLNDMKIDKPVINIPGCPPNPHNFLSTVVHYLMYGLPELDSQNRPKFAYGTLIHDQCERRAHFDSGRFAEAFGDEGHRKGYCLYKLGCKGPSTYGNCPEQGFNAEKRWPVAIGHPCFGCIEKGVGFSTPLFELSTMVSTATPPQVYPKPVEPGNKKISPVATAITGAVAGALATAVATKTKSLKDNKDDDHEND
ncbi:hydrogenase small subunit [Desulfatiferula olefinivorans]